MYLSLQHRTWVGGSQKDTAKNKQIVTLNACVGLMAIFKKTLKSQEEENKMMAFRSFFVLKLRSLTVHPGSASLPSFLSPGGPELFQKCQFGTAPMFYLQPVVPERFVQPLPVLPGRS